MSNIEIIKSLENKKIKKLSKLLQKKYREEEKKFIVVGDHLVQEAYKTNNLIEIIKTEDNNICLDIPTTYVTYDIIKKISGMSNPQSIIGICSTIKPKNIGNKVLVLDDIQDPGNLGTIIRSAVAFNVDSIVLSPDTVDIYSSKVIRSTQGMMFHIPIIIKDLDIVIDELKNKEIPVYGTRVEYGEDVRNLKDKDKSRYALIMGNEGNGVREEILQKCYKYLCIEMNDNVESLNVAVATSIILYELNK